MSESKGSIFPDERVWYDQFTSTDWVHDTIADSYRARALRSRKDFWGRVLKTIDGSQGWILSALCGCVVALIAYTVDVAESVVFDFKDGYCTKAWYFDEKVSLRFYPSPPRWRLFRISFTYRVSRNAVLGGALNVMTGELGPRH